MDYQLPWKVIGIFRATNSTRARLPKLECATHMYSFPSLLLLAHIICASDVKTPKSNGKSYWRVKKVEVFKFDDLQAELMKINDSPSQRINSKLAPVGPLKWSDKMQRDAELGAHGKHSPPSADHGAEPGQYQYFNDQWKGTRDWYFGDETEEQGVHLINDGEAIPKINSGVYPKNWIPLNFGAIARPTSVGGEESSGRFVGGGHSTAASDNRKVPLEKGEIEHEQPTYVGEEKPPGGLVGKRHPTVASDNRKIPLESFAGGEKPAGRPVEKGHSTAASRNQKVTLKKGENGRGGPKTLTAIPTRGKVTQRPQIIPLHETFLKDFEFKILPYGKFEISWGESHLFLKRMKRRREVGFYGTFRMHLYLIYTPSKAVCVQNNFVYRLRDVHYLVCTKREMDQEEFGSLWSFLEARNERPSDWWLKSSIVGAFKIQK